MPLIYITGPTGSGKSTICKKLRRLGYDSYDTDEKDIRFWINIKTNQPVEAYKKYQHSSKWHSEHRVGLSSDWIGQLKSKSDKENKNIYICGTSENDLDFSDAYAKIILLNIDEDTQKARILDRTNSKYGKEPKQLIAAVKHRQVHIDKYEQAGAYEIDGTLPADEIIKKILATSK